MKVGIYARYSSDNQREASIADQLRICRSFAERQGWTIADEIEYEASLPFPLRRIDPRWYLLTRA